MGYLLLEKSRKKAS